MTIKATSSTPFYILCVVALIATNFWSLATVKRLDAERTMQPPGIYAVRMPELKDITLQDGRHPLSTFGSRGRLGLLYLYSPLDCPEAIQELGELEKLHRQDPRIDIRAIALNDNASETAQTKAAFGLSYPVEPDLDGRVKKLLDPPQTPWKILFDTKTGRLLFEEGPSITPEEKIAFHDRVEYLIKGTQVPPKSTPPVQAAISK